MASLKEMTLSERNFHAWLNRFTVGHIFIDSSQDTYAHAFYGVTKRPDFIIFPDGKKPYSVDVKEKRLEKRPNFKMEVFELEAVDIEALWAFQERYKMRVWLALTPPTAPKTWHFIDVYHVRRLPEEFRPKGKFHYIPYCDSSENSTYRYSEDGEEGSAPNRGFFIDYLTKNSPSFIE